MRQTEYEFNDIGVCLNPTVFFEVLRGKKLKCVLSVAQVWETPAMWDCAYKLTFQDSYLGGPAMQIFGWMSEDLAKAHAFKTALEFYERCATGDDIFVKDAMQVIESIKKRLAELPEPVEPTEIFDHDSQQYKLAL